MPRPIQQYILGRQKAFRVEHQPEAAKPATNRNTGHIGWLPVRVVSWMYHNLRYLTSEAMERFHRNDPPLSERPVKTVFVGAGPIGLWSAIQQKLNNPNADIKMFDKYSDYKRSHTVRVDTSSFSGACKNEGLRELEKKIRTQHGRIACNELEKDLLTIARDLGIQIDNNSAEVVKVCPDSITLKSGETFHYDQLVGADGAHSKMRKAQLQDQLQNSEAVDLEKMDGADGNDEFAIRREIQHRVRVRYQVKGDARRLNQSWGDWARYYYPVAKVIGSPVDEHISKPDSQGNRTVTLDFFISKDEYNELYKDGQGFNLKKPACLNDIRGKLSGKIKLWQGLKETYTGESRVPDSEQVTPYALSYFQARNVTTFTSAGKPVYLAGDSSTALPYFRSLNNGLLCGTRLGVSLARGDRKPRRVSWHTDSYANFVDLRARKEFMVARLKDRAVNLFNGALKLANKLPFQISCLDPTMVENMMTRKA